MSHSYDIIKPLSMKITCGCGVFIPVSSGITIMKIHQEIRVIVENKVANSFPDKV